VSRGLGIGVVVVLLVAACSGGDDDGGRGEGRSASTGSTTTSTPAEEPGIVDLDELAEATGAEVTRVVPELGPEDELWAYNGDLQLAMPGGEVLVAKGTVAGEDELLRSSDGGGSWQPADLPNLPEPPPFLVLDQVGTSAVVAGSDDARRRYLWASDDGVTWRGGPVDLGPGGSGLTQIPGQLPDGRLMMPMTRDDPQDDLLLVSADRGATWERIDCPAETLDSRRPGWCLPVVPMGDRMWVRYDDLSLDAGRTWQTIDVQPDPGFNARPRIQWAVDLADADAGWLGVADTLVWDDAEETQDHLDFLVRSADGVRWETVLADPCQDAAVDHSGSWFSRPVPLGDRWLVASTCTKFDAPLRSELHLVDAAGTDPELVAAVDEDGVSFGSPVVAGSTVVVPELEPQPDRSRGPVTFLQLDA
jgi:hypothetical protein